MTTYTKNPTVPDLGDADDIAAVLTHRLNKAAAGSPRGCRMPPRLIAGLIPEPLGPMSDEHRQSIDERGALIEHRAQALAEQAIASRQPWTRRVGGPPQAPAEREKWLANLATVAGYRARYRVVSDLPVGRGADNDAQRFDRERALLAVRRAEQLSAQTNSARGAALRGPSLSGP